MRQICIPSIATPRSILASRIFANSDPAAMIREIQAAHSNFQGRINSRLDAVEEFQNEQAVRMAAFSLNGSGGSSIVPVDREYSQTFASYFRTGLGESELRQANASGERGQILASMTSGNESQGGYLAPVEWDRQIHQAQRARSPLRRLCDVRVTSKGGYSTLWKLDGSGTGWVGEEASRPATTTPSFASLTFGHGEIYANPAITQTLLDDSELDLGEWIATEIGDEFDKQESVSFLSGNGVNKPFGMLLYVTGGMHEDRHPAGAIQFDMSGHATQLTADGLVLFTYKLPAPYRQNASWLMNSATAAAIALMKDGQGNFIWREGMVQGQPATLLGRPVAIDENMPNIAAGALPILFGDFRAGYVINDRKGVRILRDPYTNKPYVHFYTTKRVGGGVKDPNALRALKVGAA